MLERDGYPPGVPCWVDTAQPDPGAAVRFYGAVFGWEATPLGAGGPTMWRMPGYGDFLEQTNPDLRRDQAEVGAPPGFEDAVAWLIPMTSDRADDAPHWSITFSVDDADAAAARAAELGGEVLVPPVDEQFVRSAVLRDPQGAVLTVSKFQPPG